MAREPGTHFGSIRLSQGLLVGSQHGMMRTPVLATWHIRSKKATGRARATLLIRCKWMSPQGKMEEDGEVLSWQ